MAFVTPFPDLGRPLPGEEQKAASPATPLKFVRSPRVVDLAANSSLLDLDAEIDGMLDIMQDELESDGAISNDSKEAFEFFCAAFDEKVDRIARFLSVLEARAAYCRREAVRLQARAKTAESKERQLKALLLYYLQSHSLKKVEGREFTISARKNSQDLLRIDEGITGLPARLESVSLALDGEAFEAVLATLPPALRQMVESSIQQRGPSSDAIRAELQCGVNIPGAALSRGFHVRIS